MFLMKDEDKVLNYFNNHREKLRKELHRFYWNHAKDSCPMDLYFYPDTHEFRVFANPGHTHWLDDNHLTIASCNGDFDDKGHFREYVDYMVESTIDCLFYKPF